MTWDNVPLVICIRKYMAIVLVFPHPISAQTKQEVSLFSKYILKIFSKQLICSWFKTNFISSLFNKSTIWEISNDSSFKKLSKKNQKSLLRMTLELKNGGFVFYLVTKEKYFQKPTYLSLESSLICLRDFFNKNGVSSIGIPKIGDGLDKLDWEKVKSVILKILSVFDCEKNKSLKSITVYVLK